MMGVVIYSPLLRTFMPSICRWYLILKFEPLNPDPQISGVPARLHVQKTEARTR